MDIVAEIRVAKEPSEALGCVVRWGGARGNRWQVST